MVLYYNQNSPPLAENTDPSLLLSSDIQKSSNSLYTPNNSEAELYQENKGLLEILNTSLFGNTPELYSKLLEENFANLSSEEKMIYLFKITLAQDKTVKTYMSIILFLLIIIVIKLYV